MQRVLYRANGYLKIVKLRVEALFDRGSSDDFMSKRLERAADDGKIVFERAAAYLQEMLEQHIEIA